MELGLKKTHTQELTLSYVKAHEPWNLNDLPPQYFLIPELAGYRPHLCFTLVDITPRQRSRSSCTAPGSLAACEEKVKGDVGVLRAWKKRQVMEEYFIHIPGINM
ncbi:hypothetical protein VNI00_002974 [Paramarasmius palmivorus]|uniref:Uncharacterized protein n=1 Tax=Paramarasmius palmivorus TaxID=297713 RepID=A0AAW0DUB0_9AGAR